MSTIKKFHQSERGIASLIITLVLMIVISLIVLGFAQIARREQRNSLDRQLSTQAFYAAESGVDDVKAVLKTVAPTSIPVKTSCQDSTPADIFTGKLSYTVDATHGVSYPCILVTSRVAQLVKQPQNVDTDWVMPITPVKSDGTPSNLKTLTVSWTPQSSGALNGCSVNNPVVGAWATSPCDYSLLRFEIVPVTNLDRDSLTKNDMVSFFYPSSAGTGKIAYTKGASEGNASCTATACIMNVDFSSAPAGSYYMRIHTLYAGTNITVTGVDSSGATVDFSGAQVQIDATGKAQDVLRRIRVSYSLTAGTDYPQDALQTTKSICKRFTVVPGQPLAPSTLEPGNDYCGN